MLGKESNVEILKASTSNKEILEAWRVSVKLGKVNWDLSVQGSPPQDCFFKREIAFSKERCNYVSHPMCWFLNSATTITIIKRESLCPLPLNLGDLCCCFDPWIEWKSFQRPTHENGMHCPLVLLKCPCQEPNHQAMTSQSSLRGSAYGEEQDPWLSAPSSLGAAGSQQPPHQPCEWATVQVGPQWSCCSRGTNPTEPKPLACEQNIVPVSELHLIMAFNDN